jgi:hypothetical protein
MEGGVQKEMANCDPKDMSVAMTNLITEIELSINNILYEKEYITEEMYIKAKELILSNPKELILSNTVDSFSTII